MKPKPYLKPAVEITMRGGTLFTQEMIEKLTASINKSSVATSKLAATLRATMPTISNPWAFGTIHRNKVSDERVMVVGYRKVAEIGDRRMGVEDTVEDWFDYWVAEPDT